MRLRSVLCAAVLLVASGCGTWQGIKDNDAQFSLVTNAVHQGARMATLTLLVRDEAETKIALRIETGTGAAVKILEVLIAGSGEIGDLGVLWDSIDVHMDEEIQPYVGVGLTIAVGYLSAAIEEAGKLDKKDLAVMQAAFAGVRDGAKDYQLLVPAQEKESDP